MIEKLLQGFKRKPRRTQCGTKYIECTLETKWTRLADGSVEVLGTEDIWVCPRCLKRIPKEAS